MPAAQNDGASAFLARIQRIPVLNREEERALAVRWREEGDRAAAQTLVNSNMRFVVRIAREYRSYGCRIEDLVQEGAIGLMRAVEKFDPSRGYRLISYGVWWIRAYIHNWILRSWSLVRMGTTQLQRRLFYQLGKARRRLSQSLEGISSTEQRRILAEAVDATPEDIAEMDVRTKGRDVTLDAPIGDESGTTHLDCVPAREESPLELLCEDERKRIVAEKAQQLAGSLPKRERYILENRILSEEPMCLREIGDKFGISRERARQLEEKVIDQLRVLVLSEARAAA